MGIHFTVMIESKEPFQCVESLFLKVFGQAVALQVEEATSAACFKKFFSNF